MSEVPDSAVHRVDPWRVEVDAFRADMRVPGRVYADERLFGAIRKDLTLAQVANVTALPGIVGASLAMPDAHQGYGFPIGGVAATDVADGGVVSPGGVGFDINCGVRLLSTELQASDLNGGIRDLVDGLFERVPVGFSKSKRTLLARDIDGILRDGARWAVGQGLGTDEDLAHLEEGGAAVRADPHKVSDRAKERGLGQLGTLGSGNHFVEVQVVDEVFDADTANVFGLREGQLVILVHTGSRGLGHQVCSDAVKVFRKGMREHGITVPDGQLACAPVSSKYGQDYLAAMFAAANYAWANRQVITHRVRETLDHLVGRGVKVRVVYDVAHNMAKLEEHEVDGRKRLLCVHRKGATRAFAAGHPELPDDYRAVGQPVFIPGSMGTASYTMVGTERAMDETFGSVCHGAGRAMSRKAAQKATSAADVTRQLEAQGIHLRSGSKAGIVEEFPGAYKDVHNVIDVVQGAGLARAVARMRPLGVVKG